MAVSIVMSVTWDNGAPAGLRPQNRSLRCKVALSVALSSVNVDEPDFRKRRCGVLSTTGIAEPSDVME